MRGQRARVPLIAICHMFRVGLAVEVTAAELAPAKLKSPWSNPFHKISSKK